MKKKFLLSLSVLIGTIVGAGMFGIPYVVSKSGIIPGFFYLLFLGIIALLLHLFFGEIFLRTKDNLRLPGLADKYLNPKTKFIVAFSTIFGIIGTLLAYIIIGGDFLKIVLSPFLSLPDVYFNLIFWMFLSYFIFRGLKTISIVELIMNCALFLSLFFILFIALPKVDLHNFSIFNGKNIFLPYGVILFSFIGWTAIPSLFEILKTSQERKKGKNIIILSSLVVFILYILFAIAIVGISGANTSTDALSGILPFIGDKIITIGAIFGMLAVATSFLIIGNYLKDVLSHDYKIPHWLSALIACLAPLAFFLIGFREFITVIGVVGTVVGAIEGILIVIIYKKAKKLGDKEPEYKLRIPAFFLHLLILIFILGAISQLIFNF